MYILIIMKSIILKTVKWLKMAKKWLKMAKFQKMSILRKMKILKAKSCIFVNVENHININLVYQNIEKCEYDINHIKKHNN